MYFQVILPFQCTKQVELDLHMKKHLSTPRFFCDKHNDGVISNESFSKKVDLDQHILSRMIDNKEAQCIHCIECFKGFNSQKYVEDHIKREHMSGLKETCPECGDELRDRQARCLHRIKHLKEKDDNYM